MLIRSMVLAYAGLIPGWPVLAYSIPCALAAGTRELD